MTQTIDLAEFPHGVRCHVCFHEFEDGEQYSDQFEGVSGNNDLITNIICVPCSGGHSVAHEQVTLHLTYLDKGVPCPFPQTQS